MQKLNSRRLSKKMWSHLFAPSCASSSLSYFWWLHKKRSRWCWQGQIDAVSARCAIASDRFLIHFPTNLTARSHSEQRLFVRNARSTWSDNTELEPNAPNKVRVSKDRLLDFQLKKESTMPKSVLISMSCTRTIVNLVDLLRKAKWKPLRSKCRWRSPIWYSPGNYAATENFRSLNVPVNGARLCAHCGWQAFAVSLGRRR
jgi:hypothetical protein